MGTKAIRTDPNFACPDFNFDPTHRRRRQSPFDLPVQARPQRVWEKAISEAFPGEWHELSAWVKKQLNDFDLRCSAGYLHNHAELLLAHTIKNWRRFTENAEDGYGAFGSIPTRPSMTFLLKYLSAAVNLYLSDTNQEFIGTRVQPKAPSPSKPSQKPSSPAPDLLRGG